MGRPKLDTPNYRLARREGRFYVRWWENGSWKRISAGTSIEREAQVFLAQFIAGQGTPEPAPAPTVEAIVDTWQIVSRPCATMSGWRWQPSLYAAT
jgi:hypothetical protein